MSPEIRWGLVLCCGLAFACSKKPERAQLPNDEITAPAQATGAAVADSTSAAEGGDPVVVGAYDCVADGDCMASCSQGAVSVTWYQRTFPGGEACEDGCADKRSETPRCEAGKCVAYRDGKRADTCTGVAGTRIDSPGPAHRCQSAADCMNSCTYGAVNKEWYSWGKRSECRDGCTSKGTQPARCENGTCVSYRLDKRDDSCTLKSIW